MKKFILGILLMFVVFSNAVYANNQTNEIRININNQTVKIPENYGNPYIENSRTMVPVRFISEYLGHSVEWNSTDSTIIIDKNIKMKVNSNIIDISGKKSQMDTIVVLKAKESRVYVPLRFISEALGHSISYTPATERFYHYDYRAYIDATPHIIDIHKKVDLTSITSDEDRKADSYNEDGIFIYTNKDGIMSEMAIASMYNPAGGKKPKESTIEDDILNLNKNFHVDYNIKKTPDGYSFQEIQNGTDPFAVFAVDRENGKHVVYIRDWAQNDLERQMERYIMGLNGVMETLKYYSKSYSDGEKIFAYIDKQTRAGQRITPESTGVLERTFGTTKVRIEVIPRGIKVIFD